MRREKKNIRLFEAFFYFFVFLKMWFESVLKSTEKKFLLFQKCAVNFWLKKWLENARKFIQPHHSAQ